MNQSLNLCNKRQNHLATYMYSVTLVTMLLQLHCSMTCQHSVFVLVHTCAWVCMSQKIVNYLPRVMDFQFYHFVQNCHNAILKKHIHIKMISQDSFFEVIFVLWNSSSCVYVIISQSRLRPRFGVWSGSVCVRQIPRAFYYQSSCNIIPIYHLLELFECMD